MRLAGACAAPVAGLLGLSVTVAVLLSQANVAKGSPAGDEMAALADAVEAKGFQAFDEGSAEAREHDRQFVSEKLGEDASWGRRRRQNANPDNAPGGGAPKKPRREDRYPYVDSQKKGSRGEPSKEWVKRARQEELGKKGQSKQQRELDRQVRNAAKAQAEKSVAERKNEQALASLEKANGEDPDKAEAGFMRAAKGFGVDFASTLMNSLAGQKVKPLCSTGAWGPWSSCEKACTANQFEQDGSAYQRRERSISVDAGSGHMRLGESAAVRKAVVKAAVLKAKKRERAAKKERLRMKKRVAESRKKIAGLTEKKANEPDLEKQVNIDYEIEKEKRVIKRARERAHTAAEAAVRARKGILKAEKRKTAEEQAEDDLVRTINQPPYCQQPKLEQTRKCPKALYCPVDCVVSPWSEWPSCKADICGLSVKPVKATHARTRRVVHPDLHGGKKCPPLRETRACIDESCVWKIPEQSASSLPHCKGLLLSQKFQRWSQLWLEKRDQVILRAKYDMARLQYEKDLEKKATIDAAVIHIRRKIERLCQSAKHLHRDLRVPLQTVDFRKHCLAHLGEVCKSRAFVGLGQKCNKLMAKSCSELTETLNSKMQVLARNQATAVSDVAEEIGRKWSKKCDGLVTFTDQLLDRFMGAVQSNRMIQNTKEVLFELGRRIHRGSKVLSAYESTMMIVGKDTWSCSRVVMKDIRQQNFKCIMQTHPPMKLVVCKGDQVGRLLASTRTDLCSKGAVEPTVPRFAGEVLVARHARQAFGDMTFGCQCPRGTSPQNGQCCRKGEIVFSNSVWSPKYNTTIVAAPRCQCPPGSSFITRTLGNARWKARCEGDEAEVGFDTCIDHTGQSRDMEAGRIKCCQLKEGSCTTECPPGQWRLANGFCESAMLQGCYDYSTEDYRAGEDVRCHLPATEVVITKDECKGESDVWVESQEFGGSYCKRPTRKWESLRRECTYTIDKTKLNTKNCRNFARASFTPPAPPVPAVHISYFSFVSETSVTGEGSPGASGTGERLTGKGYNGHNEDLPWSYQTAHEPVSPYTAREYNTARKPASRRLLHTDTERDEAIELLSSRNLGPDGDVTAQAEFIYPKRGQIPSGHTIQPMSSVNKDLDQTGYLKKRKQPLAKRQQQPEGGFYSYKGVFKLSRFPSYPTNDETDPIANADNLVQVGEGSSVRFRADPLKEAKYAMAMEEILKAGQEFKDAKNLKLPPLHDARPGEGSTKKACVAPPGPAECFAYLYSSKQLKHTKKNFITGNPSQCLSNKDHAWFRVQCEQY